MTSTLYEDLRNVQIEPKAYRADYVRLSDFYDNVGEDSKRLLGEIEEREIKGLKKRIIERYANRHQSISNILDGKSTFYSLGLPIIEHAKEVEEKYSDRKFGLVKKNEFLGIDPRSSNEVQEAVQYLIREEIINPNNYFRSQLILPQFIRGLIQKWNTTHKPTGVFGFLGLIGKPILAGVVSGYIGYQHYEFKGALIGGLTGYLLGGISAVGTIGLEDSNLEKLSKQIKSFENAINFLDSEVREQFPVKSKLRIVDVA